MQDDVDDPLLAALPTSERAVHGVPDARTVQRRRRGFEHVRSVLGADATVRVSPLGPGWSGDVDVHVDLPPDDAVLASQGWLRVDPLLRRLGRSAQDRWAVRADGVVWCAVDFQRSDVPEQAAAVLERILRRREVRLREVLELRQLVRTGAPLPDEHPLLGIAAAVEQGHGGDLLARWRSRRPTRGPVRLPRSRPPSPAALGLRLLPPRLVVAVSGVDGSGKSTLAGRLSEDLRAAGVPVTRVWTRPGMGLGPLVPLARMLKRITAQPSEPALREMSADPAARPATRRGAVGRAWVLLVTASYLAGVWREHVRSSGVVLYDRHVLDAIATLEVLYRGPGLALPRTLVRQFVPAADVTFYLRVPPAVAWARKPDEAFQEHGVRAQVEQYELLTSQAQGVVVLDGTAAPTDLSSRALQHLLGRA